MRFHPMKCGALYYFMSLTPSLSVNGCCLKRRHFVYHSIILVILIISYWGTFRSGSFEHKM